MGAGGSPPLGSASAANVGRLLPVPIAPAEAVALLLGDVLRLEGGSPRLKVDKDARAYLLTLTRGAVVQRIWVGAEDLRVLRADIRGAPGLRVSFGDFQAFNGLIFPMEIQVQALHPDGSPAGTELGLKYKDVELNVALEPALFTLEPPPGARRVELDAAGSETGAPPPPSP